MVRQLQFLFLAMTLHGACRAQPGLPSAGLPSPELPSPERFINAVFPTVVDSSLNHYFLLEGADTCRFVTYDYN
ncbi:MAG TPA: hypothetical protein VKU83_05285, partial [Puia sp.]|nr:hypothetical protein [Puia sp.]